MRQGGPWRERAIVAIPFLWLLALFLLPFLVVVKISLSQTAIAQPPYIPILDPATGLNGLKDFLAALTFDNYAALAGDRLYLASYGKSLQVAIVSTAILLLVGYPIAYSIARAPRRAQAVLVLLVVLPFWTSLLIRVYAWIGILQREGIFNDTLRALGIIDAPVAWLSSDTAVYIGIVYSYLPFMVLPIYSVIERMDDALLEAAADLGAPPLATFWRITLPLTRSGIFAGCLLCFIPIVGEFVIPDLLGGSNSLMIGQTLWLEFFTNRDWPLASTVGVVMLAGLVLPLILYERLSAREFGG